jgi:hypothetical protein
MRPVSSAQTVPVPSTRLDARDSREPRDAVAQEISMRQTAEGGQIVVRRVVGGEGRGRTLHIDAVVR